MHFAKQGPETELIYVRVYDDIREKGTGCEYIFCLKTRWMPITLPIHEIFTLDY